MAKQENARAVESVYAAFGRADIPAVLAALTAGVIPNPGGRDLVSAHEGGEHGGLLSLSDDTASAACCERVGNGR